MIKNLFKKLCCCHEWQKIRDIETYASDYKEGDDLPLYFTILYCCKKCGKFKKVRIG